jgi:PAS domain S-box-containing protein
VTNVPLPKGLSCVCRRGIVNPPGRADSREVAAPSAILDGLSDPVIASDDRGKVLFANRAVRTLLGWDPEQLVGRPLSAVVPAEHATAFRHGHGGRKAHRDCPGEQRRITALHQDGSEVAFDGLFACSTWAGRPVVLGILRAETVLSGQVAGQLLAVPSEGRSPGDTVVRLLEVVGQGLECDVATLWTLDDQSERLRCTAVWREVTLALPRFEAEVREQSFPLGTGLPWRAWTALEPAWITDLSEDGEAHGWSVASEEGLASAVAFPVTQRSRATGVIVLFLRRPSEPEGRLLQALPNIGASLGEILARQAADRERDHALERLRVAERRQRFLSDASRVLTGSLGHDDALSRLAHVAVPFLADGCVIDLLEDGAVRRIATVLADPNKGELARQLQAHPPDDLGRGEGAARVLRTGEPLLYPSMPDELLTAIARNDEHLKVLRTLAPTSAMIVPLTGLGRTHGALQFLTLESERVLGATDLALAEELARRVGLAVATAQLYERELAIASTLQQSLLPPRLPEIPGLEVAARLCPGGSGVVVGGDFYDVFSTGEGEWAIAIGDVCGKGASAASRTAQVRHTARALMSGARPPLMVLKTINRLLLEDQDGDGQFCTAVYGTVRPTSGGVCVRLTSAGHPLPLVRHPDGAVEIVRCSGTLLGVVEEPEYHEQVFTLEEGAALVLYTDGVTEARGTADFFGDRRLHELLRDCGGLDADAIAARVEDAVLDFSAGMATDDLAVLVLRVVGPVQGQP